MKLSGLGILYPIVSDIAKRKRRKSVGIVGVHTKILTHDLACEKEDCKPFIREVQSQGYRYKLHESG
jgi:hypothetical protein